MSKCTITNKRASRARIYLKQSFAKSFNHSAFPCFILIIREKLAEGFENQILHKSAFFETFGCARHSENKFSLCSHLHESSLRLSAALGIVKTSFPSALTCTKVLAKPKWTSPLGSFGLTKTFSKVQRRRLEMVQRNETGGVGEQNWERCKNPRFHRGFWIFGFQKSSVSSEVLSFPQPCEFPDVWN